MYPFKSWPYPRLCNRLDSLVTQDFHNEAVIAAAQTIEQAIRRVLKQFMNTSQQGFDPRNKSVLTLGTTEQRDESLRSLEDIQKLKDGWRSIVANGDTSLSLPQLFNGIVGANSWNVLVSKRGVTLNINGVRRQLPFGFMYLRHRLVHGTDTPSKNIIRDLASWGVSAVKALLDPQSGLKGHIGWDPMDKISPFRARQ